MAEFGPFGEFNCFPGGRAHRPAGTFDGLTRDGLHNNLLHNISGRNPVNTSLEESQRAPTSEIATAESGSAIAIAGRQTVVTFYRHP